MNHLNLIRYSKKSVGAKLCVFITVFSISSLNPACTKLEEKPYSQLTDQNFLQSEAEIVSAIGAAYSGLRVIQGFGNTWTMYCTADEAAIPGRTGGDWAGDGQDQQMTDHKWIQNNRLFTGTWLDFFGQVSTCNRLIYQLEKLDPLKYKSYVAEVKTVRALWYLWLVDMWGNVPIVDKFDVPADYLPATNSRAEVYAFIEKEVQSVLPELTKEVNTTTYGRATYWTAQSILAKLYLNAEVYTGTAQWQKSLDACNEIINSGKYFFTPTYKENFTIQNQNSKEAIFSIPFDGIYTQWAWMLPLISLHPSAQQMYDMTNQPYNGISVQTNFFNLYEDNDIRKKDNFLWGPLFTSSGQRAVDPGYEKDTAIDPDGPEVTLTPTFISLYNTARQSGARVIKWEVEKGNNGSQSSDFFVFRFTDILLTKAEVLWRMNPSNSEALGLFNQVRARAKVEPFNSLNAERVLNERGRELFYEGWRRSDMIRFGKYNDPTIFKPYTSESFRRLFPVPENQLDANPKLVQNPGYN